MRFVIIGKIKPYVRMTQRGKYVKRNAQEYLSSKAAIQWQLREQMAKNNWQMFPRKIPLQASLVFTLPNRLHGADLDNQTKAMLDAAQDVVFPNDCWVDDIATVRQLGDDYVTIIEVEPLEPTP